MTHYGVPLGRGLETLFLTVELYFVPSNLVCSFKILPVGGLHPAPHSGLKCVVASASSV